ncbi:glycosyltransferase family 4 protein [Bizionia myxarmorum]|uniref:glycosyltransferase family 4 protein n=1 Tax=Bizionia myxarmorum TaxID=291186 RepID=UPI001FE5F130|nr:glycosyltransferase family 4 protein [Bizionia myxarmorum]
MHKKKILIVTSEFPPQPGGIGNHAYYLALYLAKNGYAVTVIADQRDVANVEEMTFDAGLPFVVERIPLKKQRVLMYFNRIRKTFDHFKNVDYVIATGKFSLWNVAFCSLFYKRQTIAVIHGSEVNFKSAGIRKAIDASLNRFDTIVAVSDYTAQLVAHLELDIHVIANGIDLEKWQTEKVEKIVLKGNPILTTVGRVSTRKGQLQVIKLLPELLKSYPELQYHCVGIPTEAADFMEVAKKLHVSNHVIFHGAVSDAELQSVLMASDVFVMLSTESDTGDVEGFGIAILEANALGLPAIGSTNCGIEDAIHPEVSGFLVSNKDVIAFSTALNELLNNKELYKVQARHWAEQHDWNLIIKHYISHLL